MSDELIFEWKEKKVNKAMDKDIDMQMVVEFVEMEEISFSIANAIAKLYVADKAPKEQALKALQTAAAFINCKIELLGGVIKKPEQPKPPEPIKEEKRDATRFMLAHDAKEKALAMIGGHWTKEADKAFGAACQSYLEKYGADFESGEKPLPPPPSFKDYLPVVKVDDGGSNDGQEVKSRGKRAKIVRKKSKTKAARTSVAKVRVRDNRKSKTLSEIKRESGGLRI